MLAMVEDHSPANVQFLYTVLTHARKVVQYFEYALRAFLLLTYNS